MKKWFVAASIAVLCLGLAGPLPAIISINDHIPTFPPPYDGKIENLVIAGSAAFLGSYSDAMAMLRVVEEGAAAPLNGVALQEYTASALKKLEESRAHYAESIALAEKAGYMEVNRRKLQEFRYERTAAEWKMLAECAETARQYLQAGDVLGTYRHNLANIDGLLQRLQVILAQLRADGKPELSQYWQLLQGYAEAALFGNYSTILARQAFAGL